MYVYQEYAGSCGKDSMKVTNLKESGPEILVIKKDIIIGGMVTGSSPDTSSQQPMQSGGERTPLSSLAP